MRENQTNRMIAAPLWASAFVIGALVLTQAGRLPEPAAYGEMSASEGDYTILTANSGRGGEQQPDEVLYVIDNRDQVILCYGIDNVSRRQIILRDGGSLATLFRRARP